MKLRWSCDQLRRVRRTLACDRCVRHAASPHKSPVGVGMYALHGPTMLAIENANYCTDCLRNLLDAGFRAATKIEARP